MMSCRFVVHVQSEVLAVDFHPRGTVLATASDDHSMRVWDLRKRRCNFQCEVLEELRIYGRCTHNLLLHNKLISEAQHRPCPSRNKCSRLLRGPF